jgi:uncharacterized protein
MEYNNELVEKTKEFVKAELLMESTGHDYCHSIRVWQNAIYIANKENCLFDSLVVQLAALLHDIEDWKFDNNKKDTIVLWLNSLNLQQSTIEHIKQITDNISFKGLMVENVINSIEGKIVQDADRLDAIGAIGIARAFAYGGHKNRQIYNPEEKPVTHNSFNEYKSSRSCTINHFYEKLLFVKDLMNTNTGKILAEKRHKIMTDYLSKFYAEWNHKF